MEFLRTAKIKLLPNKAEERALNNSEGAARFVYNWALATNKAAYLEYKAGVRRFPMSLDELSKAYTVFRNSGAAPWLKETNCASQQRSIMYAWDALRALWAGNAGYPRFHKKGYKGGFYVHNNSMHIKGNRVFISKVGRVKMTELPRYNGKVMSATVVREGKDWYLAILYKVDVDPRPKCNNPENKVGLDLGIKHLATLSNGVIIDKPESVKSLDSILKRRLKELRRTQRNSKRHAKALLRYQKTQKKYTNIMRDFLHKQSTMIAKSHGIVVAETLGVSSMLKTAGNKRFRDSIAKSYMQPFARLLAYKVQDFRQVPRYYKSSKVCSNCGQEHRKLTVADRVFICPSCGFSMDRDLNAAMNLENYSGQVMSSVTRGQQVRTRWSATRPASKHCRMKREETKSV